MVPSFFESLYSLNQEKITAVLATTDTNPELHEYLQPLQEAWDDGHIVKTLKMHHSNVNSLAALFALEELNLDYNKFNEFPTWVFYLRQLTSLRFSSSELKSISKGIHQLQNLETFVLDDNNLSELPSTFSKLEKLATLTLSCNQFKTTPVELLSLKNLDTLDLS